MAALTTIHRRYDSQSCTSQATVQPQDRPVCEREALRPRFPSDTVTKLERSYDSRSQTSQPTVRLQDGPICEREALRLQFPSDAATKLEVLCNSYNCN